MSRLQMAAVAACCFVALSSGQAAASAPGQCWQPYEIEAAKVRDLHVMLMLGALRCRGANKDIEGKYSTFLEKKAGLLSSYNNVLKTRFMRANGIAEGQHAYEQFNTKLGNSQSVLAQAGSYCLMTDTLLNLAIEAQDRELPQLATNFSESALGIDEVCEAQPVTAAAGAAPVPATAGAVTASAGVAPAVAAAPVAAPATEATEASAAAPVDAPHEAITAAGMTTVAKADEPAAQSNSAAAALEAAAVALQNAAASLKAQPAAPAAADKVVTEPEAKPAVLQPVASASPVG